MKKKCNTCEQDKDPKDFRAGRNDCKDCEKDKTEARNKEKKNTHIVGETMSDIFHYESEREHEIRMSER